MNNPTKTMERPKLSPPKPAQRSEPKPKLPVLRFTPTAWAKLLFFRDRDDTEIGGFGITLPGDPLLVRDFVSISQVTTCVSVAFDDAAVADFFEEQVEQGRKPEQFARLWMHTHPGDCPEPSFTDETTFKRVFGGCDWAIMFILARGGATYARLRFNVGPGGQVLIPADIAFDAEFEPSDRAAWAEEFDQNVHAASYFNPHTIGRTSTVRRTDEVPSQQNERVRQIREYHYPDIADPDQTLLEQLERETEATLDWYEHSGHADMEVWR